MVRRLFLRSFQNHIGVAADSSTLGAEAHEQSEGLLGRKPKGRRE
jgi:hypothetical protein